MISAAIDKILALREPQTILINGIQYANQNLHMVGKPQPTALHFSTLSGLVEYVEVCSNEGEFMIHINSHDSVSVIGDLQSDTKQRSIYADAKFDEAVNGTGWKDIEQFIIHLRTNFVQTDIVANVIKLVGNIKDEKVKTVADDGISQQVTTSSGLGRLENVIVPNPVNLSPYRTFLEIEQPESLYLLRMRQGKNGDFPECCLFHADGGLWKLTAIERIKDWLYHRLGNIVIILG